MPRNIESELGPLWEGDPKTNGFRVSIPNPVNLFDWAKMISESHGDMTQEEVSSEAKKQMLKYFYGQSGRLFSAERIWQVTLDNKLASLAEINLNAGYSPKSGEGVDIQFSIDFSEEAVIDGRIWKIADKSYQIAQDLKIHGFSAKPERDKTDFHQIIVANKTGSTIEIDLGFSSIESALSDYPDFNPYSHSILISKGAETPINSLIEFLKDLQDVQRVSSHFVDGMYRSFGLFPPNIKFEISEKTEIL